MHPRQTLVDFRLRDIIKSSIEILTLTHPKSIHFHIIIFALLAVKNYSQYACHNLLSLLKPEASNFYSMCVIFFMMEILIYVTDFIVEILFETEISKSGGTVSTMAIQSIIKSNEISPFEISGGVVGYHITEGAKSLARISKFIVIQLVDHLLLICAELSHVLSKDKSNCHIVFFVCLFGTIIFTYLKGSQVKHGLHHQKETFETNYEKGKTCIEAIDRLSVIKMFGAQERVLDIYDEKLMEWANAHADFKFHKALHNLIFGLLGTFFSVFVAYLFILFNSESGAHYTKYIIAIAASLLESGTHMVEIYEEVLESGSLTQALLNYLNLKREDDEEPETKLKVNIFNEKIELKNITYTSKGRVIFRNVNMIINKGDKIAIYGENGIGKSSLFKVLLNFEKYEGEMCFDEIPIKYISMEDYRSMITFVPQDTKLFDESIHYNLVFGTSKSLSDAIEECKKLKIHDKIMMLPEGYNTVVGVDGKKLNGGLRQKIFYCRAFLRDTQIYMFDEPTNNLDEANSEFLIEYINYPSYSNKTFIVICHDMSIVSKFPKIYKFAENKLILEK